MTPPPTLSTERLVLRGPTLDDFADSLAMWSDPEVVRYIGGVPTAEEDCWARLHRYVGHWALLGCGMWVVRDRATGRFVGELGFMDVKRAIVPPLEAPEMGWALTPSTHGKGYATEALRAAIAWGQLHFGHGRFAAIIDPANAPSIRLANKLGFTAATQATYKGHPTVIYRRG